MSRFRCTDMAMREELLPEQEGHDSPPAHEIPDPASCEHEFSHLSNGDSYCVKCGMVKQ